MIQLSTCLVCGTSVSQCRVVHVRRDDRLVKCPKCGLLFANPQYETEELKNMYRDSYRKIEENACDLKGEPSAQQLFELAYGAIVGRHPRLGQPGITVLDYGCGRGSFSAVLVQHGARCTGIELCELAAKLAREEARIDVVVGAEEALESQPDGHFDLVLLHCVLEHLRRPKEIVSLLHQKMQVGGVLCLFVPTTSSLGYRMSGGRWHDVRIRTHEALYSRRSLFLLLSRSGFVRVRRLFFWGGRLGFGPVRNLFQYLARLLGFGSGIFVTAEKQSDTVGRTAATRLSMKCPSALENAATVR